MCCYISLFGTPCLFFHNVTLHMVSALVEFCGQYIPHISFLTNLKMKLDSINVSLASFQMPYVEFIYLDPYNNTFGENNWIIICLAIIPCICSISQYHNVSFCDFQHFKKVRVSQVCVSHQNCTLQTIFSYLIKISEKLHTFKQTFHMSQHDICYLLSMVILTFC